MIQEFYMENFLINSGIKNKTIATILSCTVRAPGMFTDN